MPDIFQLRETLREDDALLQAEQPILDELLAEVDDPDLPASARAAVRRRLALEGEKIARLTTARNAAQAAYQSAVAADPMQALDVALPIVLLPVRVEVAYLSGPNGTELAVRVYPDDVHVDAHQRELIEAELAAGTAYWKAIWGAGSNAARLDAAWTAISTSLKPSRAAWVVRALTPAVPRPSIETPLDQPQPEPPLPAVPIRGGRFTRAAHTTLLPDRWHFVGFRGGRELFTVDGAPIPDDLDVSFGPPATGAATSDLPFHAASKWLVDLDAAVAVGMAVRIPLPGPDLGIHQLFVLGVDGRTAPAEASRRLESALLAHYYTRGVGFLPPGTPTNNTSIARSGWHSDSAVPSPSASDLARAGYEPASRQNAALAAAALGIDGSEVLAVAPSGHDDQQSEIAVLQEQLWPALGAKALSHLFLQFEIPSGGSPRDGGFHQHDNPALSAALAAHAAGWLRSRGSLPVLRIGNQPYGLLPASSLFDWVGASDDPLQQLVQRLRDLHPYWVAGLRAAPRVHVDDESPDATIVNVLTRVPVSAAIQVRSYGDPRTDDLSGGPFPPAVIPELPVKSALSLAVPAADAVRLPIPVVGDRDADRDKFLRKIVELFADCLAVLDPASPNPMAPAAFLTKYEPIFGARTFPDAPPADLFTTLVQDSLTDPLLPSEQQLVAGLILSAFFFEQKKDDPGFRDRVQQFLPALRSYTQRFASFVEKVRPEQYDALVRELLDVFSHRYDAWVTSLAARRLDEMRAARAAGVAVGGFGWLEDLAPGQFTRVATPPPGVPTAFVSDRQRYVHAPSLHHAATAAVLRAGFDSHDHPDALAVNLSSRRVRIADWLATGVRNGQPLGALLGYRLERGLHEAGLDSFIEPLRQNHHLPLPMAPENDEHGTSAAEAITARNVVDGLDVYHKRDEVHAEFGNAIDPFLDSLGDAVDALGDLLLAESVHHLVGGNPLKAGLAADAIGRGESIPDRFDVVRTPRSGRALTWQLGALLPEQFRATAAAAGWRTDRPRALAEPRVDAWVASLLGAASRFRIACTVTPAAGAPSTIQVGLDTMGLAALDVVLETAGEPSILERRIADTVASQQDTSTRVAVLRPAAADGTIGFAELSALAERIRTLLANASPLGPQHVDRPDASPAEGLRTGEMLGRAQALGASLAGAVARLADASGTLAAAMEGTPDVLSQALREASAALVALADHGIAAAYPDRRAQEGAPAVAALKRQVDAVLAAIAPLAKAVPPALPAATASPSGLVAWMGQITAYAQSILGRGFPFVPTYELAADSTYAASFAPPAAPAGASGPAVMAWLRRIGRVRANASALHDVLISVEALGASPPALSVAQLPVEEGARWIGLPFGEGRPPAARVATVVSTPSPINPGAAFSGLVFDRWTEHLPGLTTVADPAKGREAAEVTGIAFTLDAPDAQAPQAILLAVPPDRSLRWSLDVLCDVVQETLDLAKLRATDLGDLPRLGRVLPAVLGGDNLDAVLAAAGLKP